MPQTKDKTGPLSEEEALVVVLGGIRVRDKTYTELREEAGPIVDALADDRKGDGRRKFEEAVQRNFYGNSAHPSNATKRYLMGRIANGAEPVDEAFFYLCFSALLSPGGHYVNAMDLMDYMVAEYPKEAMGVVAKACRDAMRDAFKSKDPEIVHTALAAGYLLVAFHRYPEMFCERSFLEALSQVEPGIFDKFYGSKIYGYKGIILGAAEQSLDEQHAWKVATPEEKITLRQDRSARMETAFRFYGPLTNKTRAWIAELLDKKEQMFNQDEGLAYEYSLWKRTSGNAMSGRPPFLLAHPQV